jgi:hypothetical protein
LGGFHLLRIWLCGPAEPRVITAFSPSPAGRGAYATTWTTTVAYVEASHFH